MKVNFVCLLAAFQQCPAQLRKNVVLVLPEHTAEDDRYNIAVCCFIPIRFKFLGKRSFASLLENILFPREQWESARSLRPVYPEVSSSGALAWGPDKALV